jgi:hypothetical protein
MANLATQRRQAKRMKQDQEERENRRNAKYPLLRENNQEPATFSMLTPSKFKLAMTVHLWATGGKRLKAPAVCRRAQYGEVECKYCSQQGKFGALRPTEVQGYIVFVHNKYKRKWTDPRTKKTSIIRHMNVLLLEPGKEMVNWEKVQEAVDEKKYKKSVFQLKLKKPLRIIGQEARDALRTKGLVPEAERAEIEEMDIDTAWGHMANVVSDFDYDYFQTEEIDVPFNQEDKTPSSRHAEEDEDSDEDEDEDEDEEEKPRRKKIVKPSSKPARKKRPVAEDDDEEIEDEDAEDEEEEEEAPRKKTSKKPVAAKKKVPKKSHWANHEDEDEDDDDSEDEEDED